MTTVMGREARSNQGVAELSAERKARAPRYLIVIESALDVRRLWYVPRAGNYDEK